MVSIACQKKEAKQKTIEAHKNQSARGHSRTCHTLPWHSHKLGSGQTDRRPDRWFDREEDFTLLTLQCQHWNDSPASPCVMLRWLGPGVAGGEWGWVVSQSQSRESLKTTTLEENDQNTQVSRRERWAARCRFEPESVYLLIVRLPLYCY